MSFDSATPNLNSDSTSSDVESISNLSDVESTSTFAEAEENPVLPEAEVKSVLHYLKSNSHRLNSEINSTIPHVESNSQPSDKELNSTPLNQEDNISREDKKTDSVIADEDEESNSDLLDIDRIESPPPNNIINQNSQVQIKTEEGKLLLILPTESQMPTNEGNWSEIWQQMKIRLLGGSRFFLPNTNVHLVAKDRLLDGRQLQELAETLTQVQLQLTSVSTSRRQTAIAAAGAGYCVEQLKPETPLSSQVKVAQSPLADALYLEMTVRSGVEIRHPGTVIILGDINPGGIVVADGDILVWGRLRGVAHAGALGNRESLIMALHMEPTQLRIADAVARAPDKSPAQFYPEVAYTTEKGIRIARATDFSRTILSRMNQEV
jgi:septum site-determining protein MinC